MAHLVQCYNKGCGQKFELGNNYPDSCKYHPGGPVFHDALKGWSCCKKRSTDFTEFLSIPGCTTGEHSNVKPPEPVQIKPDKSEIEKVVIVKAPLAQDIQARQSISESYADDKLKPLNRTVASSLKSALEKLALDSESNKKDSSDSQEVESVNIGTSCKNNSCKATYQGENSNYESCISHPGQPIFHEGMKYWSCCQRKTSDFETFMSQEGCNVTKHLWLKPKVAGEESKTCRFDWHQTSSNVCISIFAKTAVPDKCTIDVNRSTCKLHIVFDGGKSVFDKIFHLSDVIVPEQSGVKMLGTKVELNLRKHDCFSWPYLERKNTSDSKATIRQLGND